MYLGKVRNAFVLDGDGQNVAHFLRDDIKLRKKKAVPW